MFRTQLIIAEEKVQKFCRIVYTTRNTTTLGFNMCKKLIKHLKINKSLREYCDQLIALYTKQEFIVGNSDLIVETR